MSGSCTALGPESAALRPSNPRVIVLLGGRGGYEQYKNALSLEGDRCKSHPHWPRRSRRERPDVRRAQNPTMPSSFDAWLNGAAVDHLATVTGWPATFARREGIARAANLAARR